MSTYVFMKFLESSGARYDRWIEWLTLGRLRTLRRQMAVYLRPGDHLLEIGCGTGTFCLLAAQRGAEVKGIDISGEMLATARQKVAAAGLSEKITLEEKGVAELDREPANSYDRIVASLVFSEFSAGEQEYAFRIVYRLLRPEGIFLFADEVHPENLLIRALLAPIRFVLQILTFLLTGSISRPVSNLRQRLIRAGFQIIRFETYNAGTLAFAVCQKPAG